MVIPQETRGTSTDLLRFLITYASRYSLIKITSLESLHERSGKNVCKKSCPIARLFVICISDSRCYAISQSNMAANLVAVHQGGCQMIATAWCHQAYFSAPRADSQYRASLPASALILTAWGHNNRSPRRSACDPSNREAGAILRDLGHVDPRRVDIAYHLEFN